MVPEPEAGDSSWISTIPVFTVKAEVVLKPFGYRYPLFRTDTAILLLKSSVRE